MLKQKMYIDMIYSGGIFSPASIQDLHQLMFDGSVSRQNQNLPGEKLV